jgi:hypothetical protein
LVINVVLGRENSWLATLTLKGELISADVLAGGTNEGPCVKPTVGH